MSLVKPQFTPAAQAIDIPQEWRKHLWSRPLTFGLAPFVIHESSLEPTAPKTTLILCNHKKQKRYCTLSQVKYVFPLMERQDNAIEKSATFIFSDESSGIGGSA